LKAIRRACGRVGLGDHDIVDDLQEMARLDPLLSPVGVSEYMLSQGMDEAIVRSVRQELEGSLCLGESLEPVVCGSDASASSPVASTASTSISAGSSVQDTLSVGCRRPLAFSMGSWGFVVTVTAFPCWLPEPA
jgi:hypothetical protein